MNQTTIEATSDMVVSDHIAGIVRSEERMQRARNHALVFLEKMLIDKSEDFQEKFLEQMNRSFLRQLNLDDDLADLALAVIIGAVEDEAAARKSRPLPPPDRIRNVINGIIEDI